MGISPSELKLKHCYWRDKEYDWKKCPSLSPDHGIHRVRDAILHYPMIEQLDFDGCCLRSIPCLRSLRNLVYLNITCNDKGSGVALNDAFQAIGPQLKHLSLSIGSPVDLSLLLKNCHNLESLGIEDDKFTGFANPTVSLRKLQRLTLGHIKNEPSFKGVFRLLCQCNQLTELALIHTPYFDDQTLYDFLERNSLLNLKVAFLYLCGLTEHGFRDLLRSAPQLEKIIIFSTNLHRNEFQRVISETNHKAQCNIGTHSALEEFFNRHFRKGHCIKNCVLFHYFH
ncbi:hypothetical protein AVEN_66068-1 [Araneus ventricosus]|uniref:Uncharacterized protein n=1 Tax=Araneus ventricosus TaxID=182803 RepID=A0A4Y2NDL3_ARAVE|nr:hypothetical protein AVEN_66068-1 [Araneus ventricosus]